MDPNTLNPIRIVYYTHPTCPVSWAMQPQWERFIEKFGKFITFQFCMEDSGPGTKHVADEPSGYLACLAVKAAASQSQRAADLFLACLRKAAMADRRDISQLGTLAEVAREISKVHRAAFDYQQFGKDFDTRATRQALQTDYQKIHFNRIDTFPTLTFTVAGKGLKLSGASTYERLVQAMQRLCKAV